MAMKVAELCMKLYNEGRTVLATLEQVELAITQAQPAEALENRDLKTLYYSAEQDKQAWEGRISKELTNGNGVTVKESLVTIRPQVLRKFLCLQDLFREKVLGGGSRTPAPQAADEKLRIAMMSPAERTAYFKSLPQAS